MTDNPRVYAWADAVIESNVALPELAPAHRLPELEVTVHAAPADTGAGARWYHEWLATGGRQWLSFGYTSTGYLLRFHGQADVTIDGDRIDCALAQGTTADAFRPLLLDQVLPLALSGRGRLVLHASAIAVDDGAVAFCGCTGSGKSTIAATLGAIGFPVLADDALVVQTRGERPIAVPTYPVVRLRTDPAIATPDLAAKRRIGPGHDAVRFAPAPMPLRAIVELQVEGAAAPSMIPLTGIGKARVMLPQMFRLDPGNRAHRRTELAQLASVTRIPMMVLRVPRGVERLPEVIPLLSGVAVPH